MSLFALFAIAATMVQPTNASSDDDGLRKALAGRAPGGEAQQCLPPARSQASEVVDGVAILYRTAGSRIWVNRPVRGTKALDQGVILVTRTPGPTLCRGDVVDLIDRYSRMPQGFLILGEFVPYDRPQ